MKPVIIFLFPFFLLSCKNDNNSKKGIPSVKKSLAQFQKNDLLESAINKSPSKPHNSNVLNVDDILVNGQKILMRKDEFDQAYQRIDSIIVESRECGNPFDWLDREWMIQNYGEYNNQKGAFKNFNNHLSVFYSNNSSFDSNNHLFLLNTAYSDKNTVKIISKNIILTNETSMAEFERLFPKAEKEILENPINVRFRLCTDFESEHSLLFYFKNDRFEYVTLWWSLC